MNAVRLRTLVLVVGLMAAGCGDRDDARFATPKSAARTLFQAMYDNDAATAKRFAMDGEGQADLAEGMTRMTSAMRRATDAVVNRYGDEMRALVGGLLNTTQIDARQIDEAKEVISGDTAVIELKGGKTKLQLRREDKKWRVDLARSFGELPDPGSGPTRSMMKEIFDATARAADQTTEAVNAGRFATGREAVQALLANMKAAIATWQQQALKRAGAG